VTLKAIRIAKFVLIAGAFPLIIGAYSYGPDPGNTTAPGDNPASCATAGCHTGTAKPAPGKVSILLPAGNSTTFTPGQTIQVQVAIADSTQHAYGFQAAARMGNGNLTQAGDFGATDANTQVVCSDGSPKPNGSPCPSGASLEYVEQTYAGYEASAKASPAGAWTYTFNWTAPINPSGPVTFYVAAVAGPGDPPAATPGNVYTSSISLAPGPLPPGPAIYEGGVVPVFSSATTIEAGSWFSIFGVNLAATTAQWNGDFPTSVGGVTVTVNNKPAYLWFVSPTQINAQAPDDAAKGTVNVVVTSAGHSATSSVTLGTVGPSFSLFDQSHAAAIVTTPGSPGNSGKGYDIIGPSTNFVAPARPVKPGEIVTLFGVGFGQTSPAVPAGKVYSGSAPLISLPQLTVGGVPAVVTYGGIVAAGLYQLNVTVPSTGSGDQLLQALAGGVETPLGVFLTVQ
jgi:uncharacterized protein (TIGR03437 family)